MIYKLVGSKGNVDGVCVAVNEIIDRDIGGLSSGARPHHFDQCQQFDWGDKPGDNAAAAAFSGGPR